MKTKPLLIMIILAVILSTLMVVQHFISYMTVEEKFVERRIEPNQVRGSWAVSNDKPYTLNLDQQLSLIQVINEAEPLTESGTKPLKLPISKLVIALFSKNSEIEILSIGLQNNKMVLRINGLETSDNLLIEKQAGSLKKLIDTITL
mgnify:CR=1 FL=1